MRKLLELVTIMVFCVSIASGSTIIVISDTGYWPQGAPEAEFPDVDGHDTIDYCQDSEMVDFLKSLGYTVDTSGMAGAYRDGWTTDQNKVDALNAADLILVSRKTSSSSYVGAVERKAWNELAVPILCQCGSMIRGAKWNWCNGSIAQQNLVMTMDIVMGHELVDGFSGSVTVFSSVPAKAQNPRADTTWDTRSSIIGNYDGARMLVDIPAGTDFDALAGTTDTYGVSGARRVYLGIYTYDSSTWAAGFTDDYKDLFAHVVDKTMNSTVKIFNDLPAHLATDIPLDLAASENDLVFTILDPNVVEVDVYLGTDGDPNLTSKPECQVMIKHIAPVTPGQYTVTLETELAQNLSGLTDYYWKVIGYEPNAITSIPEPATAGPTWQFTTEADVPVISGVSPERIAAIAGEPNVIFTVVGTNVETYQWYKDGVATPLSNGDDYSGVDTDTLVIKDIDADDIGFYYCVGMATGFPGVTSVPYGELSFKELKCHFPFDSAPGGITVDIVGGVQAQLMGGASVSSDPNTIVGSYLKLDNAGAAASDTQYVQILDSSVADYPEITISAWFRQDTRDIGCVWDFGKDQNNYFTFTPGYKDGIAKLEFRYQVEGTQYQDENEVNYTKTGGWQFVTVTLNSEGQSKIYIDGEFKGSDSSEANLADISNKTKNYIGHRIYSEYGTALPKFDGVIDELKIYNYVLSDAQIAQEYLNVMGGYVCSEGYDLQAYDYDHNCRVDLVDIAELLSKWLEHDRIYRP